MKNIVKIGQKIEVYIGRLNKSDTMTVIEIIENKFICCNYKGTEECAIIVPWYDSYRFECTTE